jgi:H+-transporting ATPase
VTKRTEATVGGDGAGGFRISKGAPQVIAALCASDPAAVQVAEVAGRFAARGYRSLAVARAGAGGPWRLLGVVPLADPPREDSAATITAARDLGVTVKMVTGDQAAIGREIARQVGLGQQILDATALAVATARRPARTAAGPVRNWPPGWKLPMGSPRCSPSTSTGSCGCCRPAGTSWA